ncbi:transglycosylase domain-containing protein [Altererythrobacter sp. KTW20L]|uniref:transglycosylase domain-containing protein n=1 Tax=Altererythrobacter sp. KTW20L TaxID=2942210 RepID=UPI0020C15A41|nr:transglycosylase domain-containing protein [Altererythrobacter sp. KTW20L]MCL6249591.1 transglycosylase domain-containing protein [Altererythrobacter sp. KTW20L]
MNWLRSKRSGKDGYWAPGEVSSVLETAPWHPLFQGEGKDPPPPTTTTYPGAFADGGADDGLSAAIASSPAKPKRTRWWWTIRGVAGALFTFILLVGYLAITAPLSKSLQPIAPPQITLLASDGTPIARNGAVVDDPVLVADLPDHVIQPFLAIEDRRFYSHWGVDPRGVARALFTGVGGGSTITQQLAKFTFLTPEQTLTRKAREALIAFWLEAWLSKDEILERYLSNAYFGDNTYGLRAASLHYFYRQPENLRPEQAAMLAGLLQAPSRLAPTRNPEGAAERMRLVRNAMVAAGYLTQEQADAMPVTGLDVRRQRDNLPTGTYFADWALPEARLRSEVGYISQTLTTTLDSRLQNIARQAVQRASLGGAQVALVAMRPNGEVVAMIGGRDYATSPFNRATQAQRQVGSTFKLFVYLAALEAGWEPDDPISNAEFTAGSYRPRNSNGTYSDTITLADAFAQSSNVAAVRLQQEVGDEAVIDMARALGITAPLDRGDPSLALGTSTMTLVELVAAYAGVAGNQYPVEPHAFARPEQGWWDWLWNGPDSFSGRTHENIEALLRQAINRGTGRAAVLRSANFGKTGTTQDNRDALFVGYAGEGEDRLVVGVWVGNDDNSPLGRVSGGTVPARIWRDFMAAALGERTAPAPRPTASADPGGPVQPLDVEGLDDIPLTEDGATTLSIDQQGATIRTDVEGVPLDIRLDQQGLRVTPSGEPPG